MSRAASRTWRCRRTPTRVIPGSAAVSSPSVCPSRSNSRSRSNRRLGSPSARKVPAMSSIARLCDSVVTCQAAGGGTCASLVDLYRESMTWQPMSLAIETQRLTLRLRDERDAAWYRELIGERGEDLPTLEEATTRLARFRDL